MDCLFDTLEVPASQRVDYFRAAMLETLAARCHIEPHLRGQHDAFGVSMSKLDLGDPHAIVVQGAPYNSQRTGAGLGEWVSLLFQLEGHSTISDGHNSSQLVPGDVCLVPPDRDVEVDRLTDFRHVILNFPIDQREEQAPQWRQSLTRRLATSNEGVCALNQLVRCVVDHHAALTRTCREHLSASIASLLPPLLTPDTPGERPLALSGAARKHRQLAEDCILAHLSDNHLSADFIAQQLGVSKRYLHKLFQAEGDSLMHWALEQRLQACKQELATRGERAISEIAYAWGFKSLAHFSRVFKNRFGQAPSAR